MLVITEVAEMVEADRKGKHAQKAMFERESMTPQPKGHEKVHWSFCFDMFIKDSDEDEMADACIRLFDLAGMVGFVPEEDVVEKMLGRYDELLRKRHLTEAARELCGVLAMDVNTRSVIEYSLAFLRCWAIALDIDLEWHIRHKMEYNEMRNRLHGKKY